MRTRQWAKSIETTHAHLDNAVLQSAGNTPLLDLHQKGQRQLNLPGNLNTVELHQAPKCRDDNRTRATEPDLTGDITFVAHRKVAIVERVALALAVFDELFDRRFHQPNAAVVTVKLYVADQLVNRAEAVLIVLAQHQLHVVPRVKDHLGGEVAEDQRDRLAVIGVRGISDQSGPRVGLLTNDKHP